MNKAKQLKIGEKIETHAKVQVGNIRYIIILVIEKQRPQTPIPVLEVGPLVGSVLPFGQIRNGKHQTKDLQHPQDKMNKLLTRTFLGPEIRKIILTWESGHRIWTLVQL